MSQYGIQDYTKPVSGESRITSPVGPRKSRKTTNGAKMSSFHHGTDIAGATPGSKPPIQNITAGKVVFAGKAGGYGNTVVVENPEGYLVQYGHLDNIGVAVGDSLPAGAQVGVMGATGNVTGVHLDLIVVKDGKTLKPDGTVLAAAPQAILKRAKRSGSGATNPTTPQPKGSTANVPLFDVPQVPTSTANTQTPTDNLFEGGGADVTLLNGATGLAVPTTGTQKALFNGVAGMGLDAGLEGVYAEAAKAIAEASDGISGRAMLQSNSPLRSELSIIFDRLEI